jgi:serine/threonine protein phosphatase 1
MSDIHGQYTAFLEMLDKIRFSGKDRLCVLGDAIDRGPEGIAVLRHIMKAPNISMILGNHEKMMLDALTESEEIDQDWYYNGFDPTITEFDKLPYSEKLEVLKYINNLKLQHTIMVAGRKFTLVHGWPKMTEKSSYAESYRRIWCEFIPGMIHRDGVTFVFGHCMTIRYQNAQPLEIFFGDDCIGIDCGCAIGGYPGRLGCLRLEDLEAFYVGIDIR